MIKVPCPGRTRGTLRAVLGVDLISSWGFGQLSDWDVLGRLTLSSLVALLASPMGYSVRRRERASSVA
jgi:hypothetical protein